MSWVQYLRLAMRGLTANKMRTALTMLGIIIGVAVVIIVVAIGQGASKSVTDAVNSLGTNLLQIRPGQAKVRLSAVTASAGAVSGTAVSSNRMTLLDANLIASKFPESVDAVAPQARGNVQIQLGSNDSTTSAMGVTVAYPYVNNVTVDKGTFFTASDDLGNHKVCVVGVTVAQKLTNDPSADLTGKTISINHQGFYVTGMLTPKGAGAFGQDQDDVILMPINTAMRRVLNKTNIDFLSIRCTTPPDDAASNPTDCPVPAQSAPYSAALPRQRRLPDHQPNRDHGPPSHGYRHDDEVAHCGRHYFAGRGWHRHHEHHAGVRYRADA